MHQESEYLREHVLKRIDEEFQESPWAKSSYSRPIKTVKDYLRAIVWDNRERDRERQWREQKPAQQERFALGLLAGITFGLLSWSRDPSDWSWLEQYRHALRLVAYFVAALFIVASCERSIVFQVLWRFGLVKFLASLSFSGLIVVASGRASSEVGDLFGVGASSLPLTWAMTTSFITFELLAWPIGIAVGFFILVHGLSALSFIWKKASDSDIEWAEFPWLSMAFLIFAAGMLIFIHKWVSTDGSASMRQVQIYRLAHLLDFNSQHHCANLVGTPFEQSKVLYIGPEQRRVLVDPVGVETKTLRDFMSADTNRFINVPKPADLPLIECFPDPMPRR